MTIDVGNGLRLEAEEQPGGLFLILPVLGSAGRETYQRFMAWERNECGKPVASYPTEQAAIDAIEAFRELEMKR